MPELPDVEVFRRLFARKALRQRVESAVAEPNRVFHTPPERVCRHLEHHRLTSARRHGKYLFVEIDGQGSREWLVLHFGMTGYLNYAGTDHALAPHARLSLTLEGNHRLSYHCPRQFGRVDLTDDIDAYVADLDLGPDAASLTQNRFIGRLRDRRGAIKSTLMDQSVIAGIGNLYADEILFQSRVHPETPVHCLDHNDLTRLHAALRDVLRGAVRAHVDVSRMPASWLLPQRRKGGRCPRCKTRLAQLRAGQRTSWFCPACQKQAKTPPRTSRVIKPAPSQRESA